MKLRKETIYWHYDGGVENTESRKIFPNLRFLNWAYEKISVDSERSEVPCFLPRHHQEWENTEISGKYSKSQIFKLSIRKIFRGFRAFRGSVFSTSPSSVLRKHGNLGKIFLPTYLKFRNMQDMCMGPWVCSFENLRFGKFFRRFRVFSLLMMAR